jgi:hypothetical protein
MLKGKKTVKNVPVIPSCLPGPYPPPLVSVMLSAVYVSLMDSVLSLIVALCIFYFTVYNCYSLTALYSVELMDCDS